MTVVITPITTPAGFVLNAPADVSYTSRDNLASIFNIKPGP